MKLIHWECNPEFANDYENHSYGRLGFIPDENTGLPIALYVRWKIDLRNDNHIFLQTTAEEAIPLKSLPFNTAEILKPIIRLMRLKSLERLGQAVQERLALYELTLEAPKIKMYEEDVVEVVRQLIRQ